MSRASSVLYLSPEKRAQVDACARRHHFVDIDGTLSELHAAGIVLSRSVLGRYVRKLRDRDASHTGTPDDTIVIVVERSSGAVITLTTSATGAVLVGLIERIGAPG